MMSTTTTTTGELVCVRWAKAFRAELNSQIYDRCRQPTTHSDHCSTIHQLMKTTHNTRPRKTTSLSHRGCTIPLRLASCVTYYFNAVMKSISICRMFWPCVCVGVCGLRDVAETLSATSPSASRSTQQRRPYNSQPHQLFRLTYRRILPHLSLIDDN